jgi:uncharacterized protein (UPF0332 family)
MIPRIAAREAYLAAYHAAEALLYERTGKIAKSHSGLRSEFARITRGEPRVDRTFSAFLAQAYELKSLSDYGTGDEAAISAATAEAALQTAARFVECVVGLVDSP